MFKCHLYFDSISEEGINAIFHLDNLLLYKRLAPFPVGFSWWIKGSKMGGWELGKIFFKQPWISWGEKLILTENYRVGNLAKLHQHHQWFKLGFILFNSWSRQLPSPGTPSLTNSLKFSMVCSLFWYVMPEIWWLVQPLGGLARRCDRWYAEKEGPRTKKGKEKRKKWSLSPCAGGGYQLTAWLASAMVEPSKSWEILEPFDRHFQK